MQQEKQADALEAFVQRFHDEHSEGSPDEPEETYHVYPVPGGMVILKEDPEDQVIDAAIPPNTQPPSRLFTCVTVLFALLLPLSAILLQVYLAGNPPSYGQVSVSAHTVAAGASGNIAAYDINQPCCAAAVRAENVNTFSGGQDERNFQTVAKADIDNAASPLKTALSASINGAFHGQLTPGEKLIPLPCSPAVSPDHHIGEAATTVTVTVSQTCRAVAYDTASLQNSATAMLITEGKKAAGAHYRLIGTVQVTVIHAGFTGQARGRASLSVHIAGVWGYQFTQTELRRIAHQIAGKPQEAARNILLHVPGIQSATIAGIDETTNIPRNTDLIHFAFG